MVLRRRLVKRLLQRIVIVDEYAKRYFLPYLLSMREETGWFVVAIEYEGDFQTLEHRAVAS